MFKRANNLIISLFQWIFVTLIVINQVVHTAPPSARDDETTFEETKQVKVAADNRINSNNTGATIGLEGGGGGGAGEEQKLIDVHDVTVDLLEYNVGETATLKCKSNDQLHLFLFWQFSNGHDVIIGPGDTFDTNKYKYDVLTGNLYVKNVTVKDRGYYKCYSKGVYNRDTYIRTVELVVEKNWDEVYTSDTDLNLLRALMGATIILILLGVGYVILKLNRRKIPHIYLESSDDEESNEDVFTAPRASTSKNDDDLLDNRPSTSGIHLKPSSSAPNTRLMYETSSIEGFDNEPLIPTFELGPAYFIKTDQLKGNLCQFTLGKRLYKEWKVKGECALRNCTAFKLEPARNLYFAVPIKALCRYIPAASEDCIFLPENNTVKRFPACCQMQVCLKDGHVEVWKNMLPENRTFGDE